MIQYPSGEFLLKRFPNGGAIVLVRSFEIAVILYIVAVLVRARTAPGAQWAFSLHMATLQVHQTIPWFGAIFAATYAALYARFSSQWNYLAQLYNQIMGAQVQGQTECQPSKDALVLWQAGFIEDAEALHLALKPMFASVIVALLKDEAVRTAFKKYTPGGSRRLAVLEPKVRQAVCRVAKKYRRKRRAAHLTTRSTGRSPATRVHAG